MEVSINGGTPKWMVYIGKSIYIWMILGTPLTSEMAYKLWTISAMWTVRLLLGRIPLNLTMSPWRTVRSFSFTQHNPRWDAERWKIQEHLAPCVHSAQKYTVFMFFPTQNSHLRSIAQRVWPIACCLWNYPGVSEWRVNRLISANWLSIHLTYRVN